MKKFQLYKNTLKWTKDCILIYMILALLGSFLTGLGWLLAGLGVWFIPKTLAVNFIVYGHYWNLVAILALPCDLLIYYGLQKWKRYFVIPGLAIRHF